MLAKKFTLKESREYDIDKLETRAAYKEKIFKASTLTCYSIDKATFDPNTMVAIRMLSNADHGVDFV